MATKRHYADSYRPLPGFLRSLREDAVFTQRALAECLSKPQIEAANRHVDVTESVAWAKACGIELMSALRRLLERL